MLANQQDVSMARVIRFLFEHGHPWPLWESGTDKYAMEPSDYGLSDDLASRLGEAWALWNTHDRIDVGWDASENEADWRRLSEQALAILRREVSGIADVRDERYGAPLRPERQG